MESFTLFHQVERPRILERLTELQSFIHKALNAAQDHVLANSCFTTLYSVPSIQRTCYFYEMMLAFESLPVELIVDIMEELDLEALITISYLSRRLNQIASDPFLNPWRQPILRNIRCGEYEPCMKHLSVRSIVPRQNWIEILSMARSSFLLFDATLPNLKEADWEECFRRRFLPGWDKWKRDSSWREVYKKLLYRVWHRSLTTCTTDESWTKYIVLNRNGSANELETSSRNFHPLAIFNEMKLQSNLAHLETHIRLVAQFADVRIITLGVLNTPERFLSVNANARAFLHPPGIDRSRRPAIAGNDGSAPLRTSQPAYERLVHPLPAPSHSNYPFYTPGGEDKRWLGSADLEEGGLTWVGGLMLTAQITSSQTAIHWAESPPLQDLDLVVGFGRNQYSSFTWADLAAIAPWMEERITRKIDGPGLGL